MGVFTFDGTENRMRWDRRSPGFMEVWYATLNHADSGSGVWLRYTITAPRSDVGEPYCELWAFVFDGSGGVAFAGKERYAIDRLGSPNGRDDGALVRIADAWLSETHMEGEVATGGRSVVWSLDIEPAERCFQHIPQPIRGRAERRVSTVCSPNLSVPFTGTVKLDDRILQFEGDLGCQSHRWGHSHSHSWTWAHCSTFDGDENALFEGVAASASLGHVPMPTLTFLYLSYEGRDLAFNELRWLPRARGRFDMPTWAFTARTDTHRIVGAARARAGDSVQVTYVDPDGSPRYCVNSEIADLAVEVYERSGAAFKHVKSLTATRTAHVEFGRRVPFEELPVTL